MHDLLKRIGSELQRKFASSLRRPLNWNMIDALVKIEEMVEAKSERKQKGDDRSPDEKPNDQVRKQHDQSG